MTQPRPLHDLSRAELLDQARQVGVDRPDRMTREELRDEIVRLTTPESEQAEARGLFGVARSMLASVVETGLNLPDAARVIRGKGSIEVPSRNRVPVATVTLAEIYAAQGHKARALRMLDEVLAREPDHGVAQRVRCGLLEGESTNALEGRASNVADEQTRPIEGSEEREPPAVPPSEALPSASPPDSVPSADAPAMGEPAQTPSVPPRGESTEYMGGHLVETSGQEVQSADAAVLWEQGERAACVYWELSEAAVRRCGIDVSEGHAALHLVGFVPHGESPHRKQQTLNLSERLAIGCGICEVMDFGRAVVMRAAVGWESEGTFIPLNVGSSLEEALDEARRQGVHDPDESSFVGRAVRAFGS